MFRLFAVVAALVEMTSSAAFADCDARSRAVWSDSRAGIVAEAMAQGQTCANAVVTLVLRDSSGKPLWVDSRIGAQVMIFAGVNDRGEMMRALSDWIDQRRSSLARSDKLPNWPQGANAPQSGEFPFYPDGDVDREMYMKIRGQHLPLFCYVQGMESLACVALTADGVTKVGLQTFPG